MKLPLEITAHDDCHYIKVEVEEYDLMTLPGICRQIETHVRLNDISSLVIDLSAVRYVDSAVIGFLVIIWRKFMDAGKRFSLVAPDPDVHRIMEYSGIDDLFPVYWDIRDSGMHGTAGEARA